MKRWKHWAIYAVIDMFMWAWIGASLGLYLAACYKAEVLTGSEAIGYGLAMWIIASTVEKLDMWIANNRHNPYKGDKS